MPGGQAVDRVRVEGIAGNIVGILGTQSKLHTFRFRKVGLVISL